VLDIGLGVKFEERAVRGRDDERVHPPRRGVAHAEELSGVQEPQELRLQEGLDVPDLVEEQNPWSTHDMPA
jgi:hypothetical protein